MTLFHRLRHRWARRIAALFVGLWIFAAASPCVMAMDTACDQSCVHASESCGLAALDCDQLNSNPLPSVSFSLPDLGVAIITHGFVPDVAAVLRAQHRQRLVLDLSRTHSTRASVRLLT